MKGCEGSTHDLIGGTILAFTWRPKENYENFSQDSLSLDRDLNPGPSVNHTTVMFD
jgi:hypothetical protein